MIFTRQLWLNRWTDFKSQGARWKIWALSFKWCLVLYCRSSGLVTILCQNWVVFNVLSIRCIINIFAPRGGNNVWWILWVPQKFWARIWMRIWVFCDQVWVWNRALKCAWVWVAEAVLESQGPAEMTVRSPWCPCRQRACRQSSDFRPFFCRQILPTLTNDLITPPNRLLR